MSEVETLTSSGSAGRLTTTSPKANLTTFEAVQLNDVEVKDDFFWSHSLGYRRSAACPPRTKLS
jgi:hypothetical protein